jgi:isocitrate dehydrogenase
MMWVSSDISERGRIMKKVVMIKGDGIGPEIADSVMAILEAAEAPIEWIEKQAGLSCVSRDSDGLPEDTLDAIRQHKHALKGPTTTPLGGGHKSVNVTLRKKLELYANVRPSRTFPGIESKYDNVDLIIVRENVEDTYAGIEHMQTPDVAQGLKIITRPGSLRICRYAFEMAKMSGRKKVAAFHKSNIHKLTDGLFVRSFYEVAKDYPDIAASDILVDNLCMQLVKNPTQFDVLVGTNLYGDIVSDLCAGLVGGLGVAPGGNIGDDLAVFEAVHGSAPDIVGKGIANPTALLLSSLLLLEHLGFVSLSKAIRKAIDRTFVDGMQTRDIGGRSTTREFVAALIDRLDLSSVPDKSEQEAPHIRISSERLFSDAPWDAIGYDIFIAYAEGVPEVPKNVDSLKLELISNRGTKVYPGPKPNALLVNWYRCRYIARGRDGERIAVTDDQLCHLLHSFFDKGFNIVHTEKLLRINGEEAFSEDQGE